MVKKTASIAGYILMVAGIIPLLMLHKLFSPAPFVIVVQGAAVLLMIWARITFGRRSFHLAANPTGGGLVMTGPYKYIRHPIYTSACLFCFAGIAAHLSALTLALGLVIGAGAVMRILCEEALLPLQYPEYRTYADHTWRMIPFVF